MKSEEFATALIFHSNTEGSSCKGAASFCIKYHCLFAQKIQMNLFFSHIIIVVLIIFRNFAL